MDVQEPIDGENEGNIFSWKAQGIQNHHHGYNSGLRDSGSADTGSRGCNTAIISISMRLLALHWGLVNKEIASTWRLPLYRTTGGRFALEKWRGRPQLRRGPSRPCWWWRRWASRIASHAGQFRSYPPDTPKPLATLQSYIQTNHFQFSSIDGAFSSHSAWNAQ